MSVYIAVEFDEKTMKKLALKQLIVKQNSSKGDFVQPETFHVTVLFCQGGTSGYSRNDYMRAMDEMGNRFKPQPFEVTLQNFNQFKNDDSGSVVWVGLKNTFPLYQIKKQLEETMQSLQVKIEKSQHNGYTPHITMGYDVVMNEDFEMNFEDDEPITIKSICLWDSFKSRNGNKEAYIYNKVHELKFQ